MKPLLVIGLWLFLGVSGMAQEPAVLFNTICAACHEGECSGRLSFSSGREGALGHIRRHGGAALSDSAADDLYKHLLEMKRTCSLPPGPIAPPADGKWTADQLATLGIPNGTGWFIALGSLDRGRYSLEITADRDRRIRLHVTDADFELVAEDCSCPASGRVRFPIVVEAAGPHFLRISTKEPLALTGLAIVPEE